MDLKYSTDTRDRIQEFVFLTSSMNPIPNNAGGIN